MPNDISLYVEHFGAIVDPKQRAEEFEKIRRCPGLETLVSALNGETSPFVVLSCYAGYEKCTLAQDDRAIKHRSNLSFRFRDLKTGQNVLNYYWFFHQFTKLYGLTAQAKLIVGIIAIDTDFSSIKFNGYSLRIHVEVFGRSTADAYEVASQSYQRIGETVQELMEKGGC